MIRGLSAFVLFGAAVLAAPGLDAQAITPHGDFGPQPFITFGGSGIPNDWVLTNSGGSLDGLLLGLTAHQRYDNPALTNDGAGTFFAGPGIDSHNPSPADPYALWNWGWYIGGANVSSFGYRFYYDFNPAAGNDRSDHGFIDWAVGTVDDERQNSWNNGMDFLASTSANVPGILIWSPPGHGAFDPMAEGQYSFMLEAYSDNGVVGSVGMLVQVGDPTSTVPEPATMTLLVTGLAGLAASRRRKKA